MEQVAPGNKRAVRVRVSGEVIEFWPTRPEYVSAVTQRVRESFDAHKQDVETLSSPARLGTPIVVATSVSNNWPKYRTDPLVWKRAQEVFFAASNRDITLQDLSDLSFSWLGTFLTDSEYHDHYLGLR